MNREETSNREIEETKSRNKNGKKATRGNRDKSDKTMMEGTAKMHYFGKKHATELK